jgi:hypothetical protein
MLVTSFTNGRYKFTDREFISPSVPMDNLYLPMWNWPTIGTDCNKGYCFGGLPYAIAIMLTTSFTNGLYKITDREFISPSVPMDNLILPMINWLTIGTDGTDGQCFGGQPYAIALMLTTSFTNGLYKFTDRQIISPSVEMDNLYLPMVNWLTTRNDGTDGQCFGGIPYAIVIMLTTSFTNGLYKFTDREFISPSVPMDNLNLPMVNWLTDGELAYRRTVFWRATLCRRNDANYLNHQRTLQIYRS